MSTKITKDLGLVAYLKTMGISISIKRIGLKGEFSYSSEADKLVNTYYTDDCKFLSFYNNIRNIKAQIENSPKEEI